ncbi:capsular biosynthesis protein [Wansuia hejianensis]|uniref:protein-tyrosine-phosphatase n=2 Tax=Wansuia hejianensis TaxID=2763667 RepID=A0A7G9GDA7_9FIRM|nr:capsular biosynthesis protein [Wansuia hejianensis]
MENMYDIHCHALQQVDDGADSLQMALDMLAYEYTEGVRTIILTPHFRKLMFETDEKAIEEQFALLCAAAAERLPDLRLYLGCEFHVNMDMIELLEQKGKRFCMADSEYVLMEFSGRDGRAYIWERLYAAVTNGFYPIIAHAERYSVLRDNLDFVEEIVHLGARLQVNADSVIGKNGREGKKFCQQLIKRRLLDFVGSDAHDLKRRPSRIAECAAYIEKKAGHDFAEQIFVNNPAEIIEQQIQ